MRRIKRNWPVLLLGVCALLLVHACSDDVTAPDPNEAPDTQVRASAPRDLGAEFAIDFFFTGSDLDGEVVAFEWRVLEEGSPEPAWTRTDAGDLTLSFPADAGEDAPVTYRTLEVRAVDRSGLVDPTPAVVTFSPLTVSPEIRIVGAIPANTCVQSGLALTFHWTGTDADSKSGTPESVRYLLLQYGTPSDNCLLKAEYEAGQFPISTADPGWSDWVPYEDGLTEGPGVQLPVRPASDLGSSYVFAIQARDIDGATSRAFTWGQEVVHVRLSDQKYPLLTVQEPTLGTDNAYGVGIVRNYEIQAGQVLEFSWSADASQYFGNVEDFRFGWDLVDPDDPEDPGWAVPWGDWSEAPARSFTEGSHDFVVQVRDRAGAITRLFYQLSVVAPVGVPEISFSLFMDVGTGTDPVWQLRWTGTPAGPTPDSPEQTPVPFAGFARRFKLAWEATSPNGDIVGYRYRVEQGSDVYTPPDVGGEKQWDPGATSFVFDNGTPPADLGPECGDDAIGCDPAVVRFPSGNYAVAVEAIDAAMVESDPAAGSQVFSVNYSPWTGIVDSGVYPRFEVRDAAGILLQAGGVAPGDTIPANSTVFFRSSGYDKFAGELPPGVPSDSLCCDEPLNYDPLLLPGDPGYEPLVRYQSRLVTVRRTGNEPVGRTLSNTFSFPDESDTISFWAGPLDYTYFSRTVDEHRRPDPNPPSRDFVAGFLPRVREDLTIPGGDVAPGGGDVADTLVVSFGDPFPENEIPYTVTPLVQKWWVPDAGAECGGRLVDYIEGDPAPVGGVLQTGAVVAVSLKFVGEQDPRDPLSPVRAWSFALFSDKDPDNLIEDGWESRDLSYFVDSPSPNEWEFGPGDAIEIWIPYAIGAGAAGDYGPGSADPVKESVGCLVARRLGDMTLRLRGRTTALADEYRFYAQTRKSEAGSSTLISIGEFGRQSPESEVHFWFFVGAPAQSDPQTPAYYWPDF